MKIRVGIVTVSDKGSVGLRVDESGPMIMECLQEIDHEVIWQGIVPDEMEQIEQRLLSLCESDSVDLILTTGGTGLSPRDVTPEATLHIAEKQVPGIAEALRACCAQTVPRAILSRGVSVTRGKTLIVNLPGSPKAVKQNMEILLPVLQHAIEILKGTASECASK